MNKKIFGKNIFWRFDQIFAYNMSNRQLNLISFYPERFPCYAVKCRFGMNFSNKFKVP